MKLPMHLLDYQPRRRKKNNNNNTQHNIIILTNNNTNKNIRIAFTRRRK
jgi:hypothetical protein